MVVSESAGFAGFCFVPFCFASTSLAKIKSVKRLAPSHFFFIAFGPYTLNLRERSDHTDWKFALDRTESRPTRIRLAPANKVSQIQSAGWPWKRSSYLRRGLSSAIEF